MKVRTPFTKAAVAVAVAVLSVSTLGPASARTENVQTKVLASGKLSFVINFEIRNAPCSFSQVNPLRDAYAGLGVHFRGPSALDGAAILDQCGLFGVDARSGEAFLAVNNNSTMNNGGVPRGPITVRFDDRQRSASLWVSAGFPGPGETFRLVGKRGRNIVSTDTVTTPVSDFMQLRVQSGQGLTSVVLRAVATADGAWVVDDLGLVSL